MDKNNHDMIRMKIPSDPRYVSAIRAFVEDLAKKSGFDKVKIEDLKLAINEALANIIEHAYGGQRNKVIFIYIIVTFKYIEIILKDFGKKVDLSEIKSRDLGEVRDGGLGVFLIKNMVDELVYASQKVGTELRLIKNR
jgi:serine/threonine-protein kinase RsbW